MHAVTVCLALLIQSVTSATAAEAPAIYAKVLKQTFHGMPGSDFVVTDAAIAMPRLHWPPVQQQRTNPNWFNQFKGIPAGLMTLLTSPTPTRAHPFTAPDLPTGVRVVGAAQVRRLFAPGNKDPWVTFSREVRADGWIALSDVLFASNQLDAVVYYEARCPGLCGEGGYVWFHRDSVSKGWSIKRKIVSWMS